MPTGPIMFALTAGQSLAGGSTRFEDVVTNAPVFPEKALGLDFGSTFFVNKGFGETLIDNASATFAGFTPLREYDTETPMSGMVNRIIYEYEQHGLSAPTIAAFNTASGGKSILTLMTKGSEIFKSVSAGLASSQIGIGDVFAVDRNTPDHLYDYYKKTSPNSYLKYGTFNAKPVMFDNYVKQLKLAYDYAVSQGYQVDTHLIINWIQGEDDIDTPEYDYLLNKLLDKFKASAEAIFGKSVTLVAAVSPTQGGGHVDVAIDQLDVIKARTDTIMGGPQYQPRVLYPANPNPSSPTGDYDHLTPEGYFVFGQQIGANIFNALTGNENKPIVISSITATSESQIVVKFSGLIGNLVSDEAAYLAAFSLRPPSDMGFKIYDAAGNSAGGLPEISSARIIGSNAVQLNFSSSILGFHRLYLGRTDEVLITQGNSSFGLAGSTLRDSALIQAMSPTDKSNILHYKNIFDFAPVQYVSLGISKDNIGQEIFFAPPDVNHTENPPVSISLFTEGIAENSDQGTLIGVLSTADPDLGDRHIYTLVGGKGSRDNHLVQIDGNALLVNSLINYEEIHTLHVRVRSTDSTGHFIGTKLLIPIINIADTKPTQGNDLLAGSRSGNVIKGLAGDDIIKGYGGADILSGGFGDDTLAGGSGSDKFLINRPVAQIDHILDFGTSDFITLKASAFGLGDRQGALPKAFFRVVESGDALAADSNDHFIFRQSDDTLWFDPDGIGPQPIRSLAVLNDFDLHAKDILIV